MLYQKTRFNPVRSQQENLLYARRESFDGGEGEFPAQAIRKDRKSIYPLVLQQDIHDTGPGGFFQRALSFIPFALAVKKKIDNI